MPNTHDCVSNTYDNLSKDGVQIYNAQLWIAALKAYRAIGAELGKNIDGKWQRYTDDAQQQLFQYFWDDETGRFNYNTGPISNLQRNLDEDKYKEARKDLAARLKHSGAPGELEPEAIINKLLYAAPNDHESWRIYETLCGASLEQVRAMPKARRIAWGKRKLLELVPNYWKNGFDEYAEVESGDIFADQLIGDFYLRKLGLEPICSKEQVESVLRSLYREGFLRNSPILGIPNLVQSNGRSSNTFQGQEVWPGVTFTILELMREHSLTQEYYHVFNQMCDVLYEVGRIPFGIPEGLNCTYPDRDDSPRVVETLLNRAVKRGQPVMLSDDLHSRLRCPKLTAGRHLRPGSVFSLLW